MRKALILALLSLLLAGSAFAQGARINDTAWARNPYAIPGAQISVCAFGAASASVTGITQSLTIATATITGSIPALIQTGSFILGSGFSVTQYNQTFQVQSVIGSTILFIVPNGLTFGTAGAGTFTFVTAPAGSVCSPTVSVFSDPGLTVTLTQPFTSDGLGNYGAYLPSGTYQISVSAGGTSVRTYPYTASATLGGNNIFTGQNSVSLYNLNNIVYFDGCNTASPPKYSCNNTGLQAALTAAGANGTVVLPPIAQGILDLAGNAINMPSNVCIVGQGPGVTTLQFSSAGGGFMYAAGTKNTCLEHLGIFYTVAAANSTGIRIHGTDANPTYHNNFRDIFINFGATASGVNNVGVYGTSDSAPSVPDVYLNTFDNVRVQFANQPFICQGCEGNYWKVEAYQSGKNVASTTMFQEAGGSINSFDEMIDARIEQETTASAVCLATGGKQFLVRLVCDSNGASATAINDTGSLNQFQVSMVGTPTLGVVGANSTVTSSSGTTQSGQFVSTQGAVCTNGELALSAGWQSTGTATVTAAAGTGQTCSWTITTGTTTAANPTVTDTLTNVLPTATTVCELNIHGGTHTPAAGEGFTQTALSATAPVFTFIGTPTNTGATYFVTRRCGP